MHIGNVPPGPVALVGVGELAEHEPVGLLVVEYDRIADVLVSALVEPGAGGRAVIHSRLMLVGPASDVPCLSQIWILGVDDLDVVIGPDIPIRIGRREWAGLPRERDERGLVQLLWRIDRRGVDRGLRARATGPVVGTADRCSTGSDTPGCEVPDALPNPRPSPGSIRGALG